MGNKHNRGRRCRLRFRTLIRWPWYYETCRVTPGEYLLRAIPNSAGYLKADKGKWSISPYAFKPHKKRDLGGMSFFREDFASPETVASSNRHPGGARVARVRVRDLLKLGLTAEVDVDPAGPAGHVVVPGMAFVEQPPKAEKQRIDALTQKLAVLASEQAIYSPRGMLPPAKDA